MKVGHYVVVRMSYWEFQDYLSPLYKAMPKDKCVLRTAARKACFVEPAGRRTEQEGKKRNEGKGTGVMIDISSVGRKILQSGCEGRGQVESSHCGTTSLLLPP